MGSLRNPIGPLPSSIYWRRRAVACAVLALVVLATVWAFGLGGDDDSEQQSRSDGGGGAAATITPGPTESGPVISDRPGGRDETGGGTGDGGTGDGGSGAASGDSDSGPDPGGSGAVDEAGGSAGGTAWQPGGGSTGGSGGGPDAAAAAAKLPACKDTDVTLKLRSTEKSYGPDEKPEFELTAVNEGGSACRVDLGRKATTVTVTDAADKEFWTSADCRRGAEPAQVQVPANDEVTRKFSWLRRPSAPDCGTPPATSAAPGDYELAVEVQGLAKVTTAFTLTKD